MTLDRINAKFDEHGINKIKLGGFDIDGVLRGKYISREKFLSSAEKGFGFCDVIFGWDVADVLYDNVKYTGWHTGYPDTLAKIDLSTFRVIPWEPGVAHFICDFYDHNKQPLAISPRQVLQQVVAHSRSLGYEPMFAVEYEFFFFQETPHSLHEKQFHNLIPLSPGMFGYSHLRSSMHAELTHSIIDGLKAFDIELEGFHTETGPGVYEAAIKYDSAVRAADKAALFKTAIKEIAHRHELVATFMAKPNQALPGCSGHTHQSLWSRDHSQNLFFDETDAYGMSPLMKQYLAGQLALMPEVCALVAPTVNSYKRMVPNTWAPTSASWGRENRTTGIRVIAGDPKTTRIEFRLAGADMNPYLGMATSLASGLYGIANKLELPEAWQQNAYTAPEGTFAMLPRSLEEATARLRQSKIAPQILGAEFVEHFILTRDWEVRQYQQAVTDWELKRYFEII